MMILKKFFFSAILSFAALLTGCMRWDYAESEVFNEPEAGLFIINEGNFQYGNSTLSFYNPETNSVSNEIFLRANGMKLGDVAQSMTIHNNIGWIVVNNSRVIFAIDIDNFTEVGRIEGFTSPRYIHFINDRKAYVSQLWDNRIYIVDPQKCSITGYITIPDTEAANGSTEQMVSLGRYVYCNCWSYQNSIIKIDSETDEVVDRLETGIQPSSLVADNKGRLWALTDGGYEGSPYGHEAPALYCIDPERFEVERVFGFGLDDIPRCLVVNKTGDKLYWLNDAVWEMDIDADRLPRLPIIDSRQTKYYSLTVSPVNNDIYVADAIDYQQSGIVYRYSSDGILIDEFYCGITPGEFCWKP